jgi:hypothetical protein
MNKQQRQPWWAAIKEATAKSREVLPEPFYFSLCHICRYPEWQGHDGEDGPLCTHPVRAVHRDGDLTADVWAGCDCWGFRPKWKTPADALSEMVEQVEHETERTEGGS